MAGTAGTGEGERVLNAQEPSRTISWPRFARGLFLTMPGGVAVLIVGVDSAMVEADLAAGRLTSPCCASRLRPWGRARRRQLRARSGSRWVVPRRAMCAGCAVTHVLLPEDGLVRRRDAADDIGAALGAKAGGAGHRSIAARLDVPAATVRGWLRRAATMAERIRRHFTRWAAALDPMLGAIEPAGSALGDAVAAIGVAAAAAVRRLGPRPAWSAASVLSGGALLSNTTCPWPAPA